MARYQDVFGQTLLELARADERIVGITPAMPSGCSMNILLREMPGRCFDVGIAEGHAVTFSDGLAAAGMSPFCNINSSFMQRAYDNVIHDVAIQDLPVVMCLDRGGLVGEDGVTHHGVFDMAAFGAVPGLTIAAPMNEPELRNMMYTALGSGHPFMIRYPRGHGEGLPWRGEKFETLPVGRGRRLREGADVALLTVGTVGNAAARAAGRAAAEGVSVAHYDLRFVKPLDEALLDEVGRKFRRVVTVEDGSLRGGVGEAVAAFFNGRGYDVIFDVSGVPAAAPLLPKLLANKGTVVYFAVFPMDYELPLNLYDLYIKEGRLQTVFTTIYNYPRVIDLIPRMNLDVIANREMKLSDGVEIFNAFLESKSNKIIVDCQH